MIKFLKEFFFLLLQMTPFLFFCWVNAKANVAKRVRSRQYMMPVLAFLYCIILFLCFKDIDLWIDKVIKSLPLLFANLANKAQGGFWKFLIPLATKISEYLEKILKGPVVTLIRYFVENTLFLVGHIILKRLFLNFSVLFDKGFLKIPHDFVAEWVYKYDEKLNCWYLDSHYRQGRTFMKVAYVAAACVSAVVSVLSIQLIRYGYLTTQFYPFFGVIVLGELFFYVDGLVKWEMEEVYNVPHKEDDDEEDYSGLRVILKRLFGDKLLADETTVSVDVDTKEAVEETLMAMEEDEDSMLEAYARFMTKRAEKGLKIDQNYLRSGQDLLEGKSIIFNNPFYYDLIPYAFYAINRTLLKRKKVLVVLGRQDIEQDVIQWCLDGFTSVNDMPCIWNVDVLNDQNQNPDVGILTRSSVHDMALHEANRDFFSEVGFVMLIEPSKLVTTAQIGLHSIIEYCRAGKQPIVYCSTDKNCDGLVDSLSHILMTNLTEVSATNHHAGASAYMCWSADDIRLQHRVVPNIAHYMGVGTELAFVGLKNRVKKVDWYGGDVFPVLDMHWIAKQYYYDWMTYADLPATQESMDQHFRVSHNMWKAQTEQNHFMVVEDDACNMFEARRDFSTRAEKQGFVNIISQEYLLKDYMAENDTLFAVDSKAIPTIVADYAHTPRNVVLRLCLQMVSGKVLLSHIVRDLDLINANIDTPLESFWKLLCEVYPHETDEDGALILAMSYKGKKLLFDQSIIKSRKRFSIYTGKVETMYYIDDADFIDAIVSDVQSAAYVGEDEKGNQKFFGTELRGHIFQKYLPGQFFTMGGKYYMMSHMTSNGDVVVRRAADQLEGRPTYRQERKYSLQNVFDSEKMGDIIERTDFRISKRYADISVETPAYWDMKTYNDFAQSKRVVLNGVPNRNYCRKQFLRIDFSEDVSAGIVKTLALLMNEVFRTLFAENHCFLAAVVPGEITIPTTYSVTGDGNDNSILILEDSQLDLGLLEAVRRNIDRIFAILCDYLDWHLDTLEKSLNPPPEPEVPEYTIPEDQQEDPRKKTWIERVIEKIKGIFKRKKKKKEDSQEGGNDIPVETPIGVDDAGGVDTPQEIPVSEPESDSEKEKKPTFGEKIKNIFGRKKKEPEKEPDVEQPADNENPQVDEKKPNPSVDEATETPTETAPTVDIIAKPEDVPTETMQSPIDESATPKENSEEQPMEEAKASAQDMHFHAMMSVKRNNHNGKVLFDSANFDLTDDGGTETTTAGTDDLEFEPVKAGKPIAGFDRPEYKDRYYLLYGNTEEPESLCLNDVFEFLKNMGYGNSGLKQARDGKDIAQFIEQTFDPNRAGAHYCDFCGDELIGTDFERLADGRERCMKCGATAIRSLEEFNQIYQDVHRDLEMLFGAGISAPIHVKMVNAKKLHKKLKATFIPTGGFDGRVLGVAIRDKDGYSILLENGAPRLQSKATIAHELTHIWQYTNWDSDLILKKYGEDQNLEVYEGMAKWVEVQYLYLIDEIEAAKREEIITRVRNDEYGRGFNKYVSVYPLTIGDSLNGRKTPFTNPEKPL